MDDLIYQACSGEDPSDNRAQLHNKNREYLLLLVVGDLHGAEIVFYVD
jgi:hypothetical protein